MSNAEMNSYLVPVLIVITLGALAWAALQNYFFNAFERRQNRYHYPPPYYPPSGSDYPQYPTPRSGSPVLTLLFIIVIAIGLYYWATGGFPKIGTEQTEAGSGGFGSMDREQDSLTSLGLIAPTKPKTGARESVQETEEPQNYGNKEMPQEASTPKKIMKTDYTVKVTALGNKANADALIAKLSVEFGEHTIFFQEIELESGTILTRIMIGHFANWNAALQFAKKLKKLGYANPIPMNFGRLEEDGEIIYYER